MKWISNGHTTETIHSGRGAQRKQSTQLICKHMVVGQDDGNVKQAEQGKKGMENAGWEAWHMEH